MSGSGSGGPVTTTTPLTTTTTTTGTTTTTTSTTSTTSCQVGCGTWTQVGAKCFEVFSDTLKWGAAQTSCESYGGSLASIESSDEQEAVKNLASGVPTWLGGNDKDKHKTWVWKGDGQKVNNGFTEWNTNKPTTDTGKDCMRMG